MIDLNSLLTLQFIHLLIWKLNSIEFLKINENVFALSQSFSLLLLHGLLVCKHRHFTKQTNRKNFEKGLKHERFSLSKTVNYWLKKWPNFPIENLLLVPNKFVSDVYLYSTEWYDESMYWKRRPTNIIYEIIIIK